MEMAIVAILLNVKFVSFQNDLFMLSLRSTQASWSLNALFSFSLNVQGSDSFIS